MRVTNIIYYNQDLQSYPSSDEGSIAHENVKKKKILYFLSKTLHRVDRYKHLCINKLYKLIF